MDQKHYSWQDGLPVGPDVTAIRGKWPALKIGDRIAYAEIAELLRIEVGSNRFRSVTNAWRKRELEEGRVLQCEITEAFYVASAEQITASTYGTLHHIGRSAKKQRRHLSTIHPTDEKTKSIVDHQARLMIAVEKDARVKRMNLLPGKTPEVPRIAPPKQKESA